jgi:hypothetical protein
MVGSVGPGKHRELVYTKYWMSFCSTPSQLDAVRGTATASCQPLKEGVCVASIPAGTQSVDTNMQHSPLKELGAPDSGARRWGQRSSIASQRPLASWNLQGNHVEAEGEYIVLHSTAQYL